MGVQENEDGYSPCMEHGAPCKAPTMHACLPGGEHVWKKLGRQLQSPHMTSHLPILQPFTLCHPPTVTPGSSPAWPSSRLWYSSSQSRTPRTSLLTTMRGRHPRRPRGEEAGRERAKEGGRPPREGRMRSTRRRPPAGPAPGSGVEQGRCGAGYVILFLQSVCSAEAWPGYV